MLELRNFCGVHNCIKGGEVGGHVKALLGPCTPELARFEEFMG